LSLKFEQLAASPLSFFFKSPEFAVIASQSTILVASRSETKKNQEESKTPLPPTWGEEIQAASFVFQDPP